MDIAKVEKDIIKFARDRGASLVGFAAVKDINRYAPAGHRPTDFLDRAKSVVVVSAGNPSAGTWKSHHPRALEIVGYARSAAPSIAAQLAGYIEAKYGYYAMLVPPGAAPGHQPYISLKLLAEMAGLGTRTMAAQTILNEKYGLVYFGAAITSLPLRPTGPLVKPLCPHRLCVKMWEREGSTPCLAACPYCLKGELAEGRIKWMEYDQLKCYSRAQTTGTDFFQKMLLEIINEPEPQRRKQLAFGSHFTRTVRSVAMGEGIVAQCFECTRVCPLGYKHRYASLS
jgi:hypothetical protein